MKKIPLFSGIAIGLMLLATVGLVQLRSMQKLEEPGLKIVKTEKGPEVYLPPTIQAYQSISIETPPEVKKVLPADTTFAHRLYFAPQPNGQTNEALVQAVLMGTDRTSIHRPEICLVAQGCKLDRVADDSVMIEGPQPYRLPLKVLYVSREEQRGAVRRVIPGMYIYWFVSKDQVSGSHEERMWMMARKLLTTLQLQRWGYVSCLTLYRPSEEQVALDRVKAFLAAGAPNFQFINQKPSQ